jgi:hypothetical protein
MKALMPLSAACAAVLFGCSSPGRPQAGAGAAPIGAPDVRVDPSVAAAVPAPAGTGALRLPERIVLPASYRLVLLDGHLTLVREADPVTLAAAPASMRILTGEIARGELAYQPGLLPQELAAEVAANHEGAARMNDALEGVMRRSRELSAQALALQDQSRRLAELLSAEEARVRELEAAGRAAPPKASPEKADPGPPD